MAVKEVSREEIRQFVMPSVSIGTPVLWHPTGKRGKSVEIAFVIRASARNVHLVTATKGVKEAVRHIDDPKLRLNIEQREMGAWDFTDYDKKIEAELNEIRSAIGRPVQPDDFSSKEKKNAKGGV